MPTELDEQKVMGTYIEAKIGMKMSEFLGKFDIDWTEIKALSVRQPFASLIVRGEKTIEWRSKPFNYRGPLVICASSNAKFTLHNGNVLPRGVAVGIANLIDCRPMTVDDLDAAYCGDYEGEMFGYAWIFDGAVEVEHVPVKGIVAPWPWHQRGGIDLVLHPGLSDSIFENTTPR